MNNKSEHIEAHWKRWKLTVAGSAIGFVALVVNLFYQLINNQLPTIIEKEIFEIMLYVIPLFIFLLFLRVGIWEYEEVKEEVERNRQNK
jgi:hypothetical protein